MSVLSSRQLSEWMAYDRLEPFGEERADLRAGVVASVIANVNRGKKGKAYSPQDFTLKFGEQEAEEPYKQSTEEMKKIMMGMAEATKPKKKKDLKSFKKKEGK